MGNANRDAALDRLVGRLSAYLSLSLPKTAGSDADE